MARTLAELPKGSRITDYINLGMLSKTFPSEKVAQVLERTGKVSQRQRDLPAHVVVYYVMALGLGPSSKHSVHYRYFQGNSILHVSNRQQIVQRQMSIGMSPLY